MKREHEAADIHIYLIRHMSLSDAEDIYNQIFFLLNCNMYKKKKKKKRKKQGGQW